MESPPARPLPSKSSCDWLFPPSSRSSGWPPGPGTLDYPPCSAPRGMDYGIVWSAAMRAPVRLRSWLADLAAPRDQGSPATRRLVWGQVLVQVQVQVQEQVQVQVHLAAGQHGLEAV